MSPADPDASRKPEDRLLPKVAEPNAQGGILGLSLPQGGLGAVFSAAFSTPETLPGVAAILRDEEFLEALSRTAAFLSDGGRDDASQQPRRAVQTLHRMESPDAVRSVGRSLIFGCAELFANRRLYLEPPTLTEKVFNQGEPRTDTGRLHRICVYLTHITDLIQDGASQFQDPTLWKIIDDEFIARIHAPLAQELNQLYRVEAVSATAVLTVFERLDECAQSLEKLTDENRQIIMLLAGFILRRLGYVLNNLKTTEVRSIEDCGLRDRIAEKLAHKLGVEVEEMKERSSAPLMQLLREASGEGYGFIKGVFLGFFHLHGDIFRRRNAWSAETADRQSRLLQGYETLGACASILWPAEFSGLIRENFTSLDPYHRAAALQILQYAVGDDPRSVDFAIREAIRLLGHGALIVRDDVCRLLSNFAEPVAHFLGSDHASDSDASTLVRKHKQFILEKVFVPLGQNRKLTGSLKQALAPLLLDLMREQGAALFRSYPTLGELLTWDACKGLDAKERQKIVIQTMQAYAEQASSGLHGDRIYVPNRSREEPTAALVAGMGPQGLIAALQYANELMRNGNRVGALAVRLVAARAARDIPDIGWTAVEKTGFTALIFGDAFAALHEVVQRKNGLLRGTKQPAPTAAPEPSIPENPTRRDDLDLLVGKALARHSLQGSLPDSVLNDPEFVGTVADQEGEVIVNAFASPLLAENRLADFVQRLKDNDLQMIRAQCAIERRLGSAPKNAESWTKRLAKLIELYSASASKSQRAPQMEFQRIRRFLLEEVGLEQLPYANTAEINRSLNGILERALRESLLGSREVYPAGDEELHLALDALAVQVKKGEEEPRHACRRFLACWFKVFPASERHRHVRVSLENVANILDAVIQREGDSDWAGKAIYLLVGKLETLLQASRNSTEALQRDVLPFVKTLTKCVEVISPEREVVFDRSGAVQRHNIRAAAFKILEDANAAIKPEESTRPPTTVFERIPRIPFEYRAGSRLHVPGLQSTQTRLL